MAGVGAGAFSLLAFSFGALQLKPLSLYSKAVATLRKTPLTVLVHD